MLVMLHLGMRAGDAVPRILHSRDVTTLTTLGKLRPVKRCAPRTLEVPRRCPRPIVRGIVVRGGGATAGRRHDTMPAEAARQLSKGSWVDMKRNGRRRTVGNGREACSSDGLIKGGKGGRSGIGRKETEEMTKARPDAKPDEDIALIRREHTMGGRTRL